MQVDAKAQNYQFFYDIESKSKATILSLNQLITNPGDGVLRPKLTEFTGVSFDLTLSGRILYVMNFLKRLEGGKYFVRFNSVTLRGNSAIAEDGVEAVLKLEVLAKKP